MTQGVTLAVLALNFSLVGLTWLAVWIGREI